MRTSLIRHKIIADPWNTRASKGENRNLSPLLIVIIERHANGKSGNADTQCGRSGHSTLYIALGFSLTPGIVNFTLRTVVQSRHYIAKRASLECRKTGVCPRGAFVGLHTPQRAGAEFCCYANDSKNVIK